MRIACKEEKIMAFYMTNGTKMNCKPEDGKTLTLQIVEKYIGTIFHQPKNITKMGN